jgi:hypothetical protein
MPGNSALRQTFPNTVLTIPEDDEKIVCEALAGKELFAGFSVHIDKNAHRIGPANTKKRIIDSFSTYYWTCSPIVNFSVDNPFPTALPHI